MARFRKNRRSFRRVKRLRRVRLSRGGYRI